MHELGVAKDLVRRSIQEARDHGGRVVAMHLLVGPDEHLNRDSLTFSIQAAASGTVVEGATISISPGADQGVVLESIEVEEVSDVPGQAC